MTTPNLELVELVSNQSNSHNNYNESLKILDAMVQPVVLNMTLTAPPGSPSNGDRYVPAATATGAWAGYEDDIAYYYDGWTFISPQVGWPVYDVNTGSYLRWNGSAWVTFSTGGVPLVGSPADNEILRYESGAGTMQTSGLQISDTDELTGHHTAINAQTGTTYTLVAADVGKTVTLSNASTITLTLPQQSTTSLEEGYQVAIIQRGAGQVQTALEGSDTMESKNSNTDLSGQHSSAVIILLDNNSGSGPNVWGMYGDLV